MPNKKINRAVILAAGDGDRMGELTTDLPKVLLPRNMQEPIIVSPIAALASVGIKHIAIVVGYLANEVKRKLGDGTQAKSWTTGEPVILCMGDHIIEPNMVWCLLSTKEVTDTLCIEYRPTQYHIIEGATKVALFEDGSIQDIGKELTRWDALDTGVFLLTERFFNAVEELARLRGNNIEMSDVIRFMVAQGHRFDTCNVSECSWMDIDTVEDLELARSKGH